MKETISMAGMGLAAILSASVQAAPVTWVLPGIVTAVEGPATAAPITLSVGDAFELSIVLDSDAADANADPHEGSFNQALLSASLGTAAGSILWPIERNAELSIHNDVFRSAQNRTVDEIVIGGETAAGSGAPAVGLKVMLQSTAPGSLASDSLPQPPDLGDWTMRFFLFNYQSAAGGAPFQLAGELGEAAPSTVPLPAPLWMLAAALLLFVNAARPGVRGSSAPAGGAVRCASTSAA